MGYYFGFKPYVPVAKRQAQAAQAMAKKAKKGQVVSPVRIEGRTIARTFWGKAWCSNLESYSDFSNRLPRGGTYVRNGSVVHLQVEKGKIKSNVSGSELYDIEIEIAPLSKAKWEEFKKECAGQIGTLVELLQGKLSKAVLELVTDKSRGLFPKPNEIEMSCSCPDYAGMCKHVAATMYGVGHRLDSSPELLFKLRAVDHLELIEQAIPTTPVRKGTAVPTIANADLAAMFDIEMDEAPVTTATKPKKKTRVDAGVKTIAKKKAPAKKKPPAKKKAISKKG